MNQFGRRVQKGLLLIGQVFTELPQTNSHNGQVLSDVVVQCCRDTVLLGFASLVEFPRQFLKSRLVMAVFFEGRLQCGDVVSDSGDAKCSAAWSGHRERSFVKPADFAVRSDDAVLDVPVVDAFFDGSVQIFDLSSIVGVH